MVNEAITKAEETQATTVQEAPAPTPATPTLEELQSRLAETTARLTETENQLKGRTKENSKLRQEKDNLSALEQRLINRIDEGQDRRFTALGEVLFPDDTETLAESPSQRKAFLDRLHKSKEAPSQELSPEQVKDVEDNLKYQGKFELLWEDTGLKLADLPEDEREAAAAKYGAGDRKGAFADIRKLTTGILAQRKKKVEEKETEEKVKTQKVAAGLNVESIPSRGHPEFGSNLSGLSAKELALKAYSQKK